ncbi:Ig-like domain-containing protein [Vibrio crassostreae]|uniref:ImpA family metalloprotease n=1 Tax=Vibrio crassostreae TaxID=246167 RepID=UPI00200A821F|nr:ImpA family metalloprotease [Vibrio crassostreae]UPR31039.1 Ig-like domain-containing protein [Vibrio crassostreae]
MRTLFFLFFSLFISGCGPDSSSDNDEKANLTSISITYEKVVFKGTLEHSLPVGYTKQLIAIGLYDDGSSRDITSSVRWKSSDESIATVNAEGVVTGESPGVSDITAQLDGIISQKVSATISDAVLESLVVTPGSVTLSKGTSEQLTATASFSDGSSHDVTSQVSWKSSDTSVATVNAEGLVTGELPGASDITAQLDGIISQKVSATISDAVLESLVVTPGSVTLSKGTSEQLTATASFSDGSSHDVTSQVSWKSSDTSVATVNAEGLVTGELPGASDITAQLDGIISQKVSATISDAVLESLVVTPGSVTLSKGTSEQLTATASFSDGSSHDVTSQVSWKSSDTSVATVNAEGLVTGELPGVSDITAQLDGITSQKVSVTISDAVLEGLVVTPGSVTLSKGTSEQLTATASFSDGSSHDVTSQVSWKSSDTSVATVNAEGLVTGELPGVSDITAQLDGITSQKVSVTISDAVLEGLVVTPGSVTLSKGTSEQLTATASFSDGSSHDVTSQVSWKSSDTSVATVNAEGLVTGELPGVSDITAQLDGITSQKVSVTISDAVLEGLVVTPGSVTLSKGTSEQLTATASFSDGSSHDVTSQVSWKSSDTSVATVNAEGLVTGELPGVSDITAQLDGITSQKVSVTISDAVLEGLVVTPGSVTLSKGTSEQLTATASFSDGSSHDVTSQVSWKSSDTSVATVNAEGVVTGESPGVSDITAQLDGIISQKVSATISDAVLESLVVTPGSVTLSKGTSEQLTATASFSDGSSHDVTSQVSWKSEETSVATVTSSGLVTGEQTGNTVVSASLGDVRSNLVRAKVSNATLKELVVTPGSGTLSKGTSEQLTATASFSDGSSHDVTSQVSWKSEETSVATVTSSGLVTGEQTGNTVVSASLGDVRSNLVRAKVSNATLKELVVTPGSVTLSKGTSEQLTATASFSDGSSHDVTSQVSWKSEETSVATVTSSGLVTGEQTGNTVVSASLGDVRSNLVRAKVSNATLKELVVTPGSVTLSKGTSEQLTATASFSDGSSHDVTSQVSWKSEETSVATVTSSGLVTGEQTGNTVVSASLGDVRSNLVRAKVSNATLKELVVTPGSVTLSKGTSEQLTATASFSDGSSHDVTSQVSWKSEETSVATVTSSGLVTGEQTGNTVVSASLGDVRSNLVRAKVSNATLKELVVTPGSVTLSKGTSEQLTATASFSDGSSHDVTSQVSWKSSDTSVATVNAEGLLTGVELGNSSITISMNSIASNPTLVVVENTPLDKALLSGNVKSLDSKDELYEGIEQTLTEGNKELSDAKQFIFSGYTQEDLSWTPNLNAIFMEANELSKDLVEPLLVSNNGDNQILASVGFRKNSKFVHYFSIPISNIDGGSYNDPMEATFLKSLEWLNDETDIANTHITISGGSSHSQHREYDVLTEWFDSLGKDISYNDKNSCNSGDSLSCIEENKSSLVVVIAIGKDTSDLNAVLDSGVPILFISTGGSWERSVGEFFDLKYVGNARGTDVELVNYTPTEEALIYDRENLAGFFDRLRNNNYTFNASECSGTECPNDVYKSEFRDTFLELRSLLDTKASLGEKMFSDYLYESRFQRLVVLLSDWYRLETEFPVTKSTQTVLTAMVADGLDYINRELNYPRRSFGNYESDIISDERITTTVDITSTTTFRSSGYYVAPGDTFLVTRQDSNDVVVKVQLNWFRDGATKEWDQYKRPKYLNSRRYELKQGESVRLTSSLGGVIFVDMNKNGTSASLKLENVVKQPTFDGSSSYDEFITFYDNRERNWFDIITSYYEWHIRRDYIEDLLDKEDSIYQGREGLKKFIDYSNTYSHNYPRILAGQTGPGIDTVDEIKNFIELKGWSLREANLTQHSNHDQATCGSGCSGNPIDSFWVPDPLGHGQIHELGHNLERAFAFDPLNVGHSVTNWYVYYSQTQKSKNTPSDPYTCADHGYISHFDKMEQWLSSAQASGDPSEYMKAIIDNGSNYNAYQLSEFMMKQLIMTVENQTSLEDGWNVIPRLHIHLEEFNLAKKSEEAWNESRGSLGFSLFSYEEAKAIAHNDYLAIAYSVVSELNLSDYYSYFGFTFDVDRVNSQLLSNGLVDYPVNGLYVIDNNICQSPYLERPLLEPQPYDNIALGKMVTGSSEQWDLNRAVDGDFTTHAETRNTGTQQWIEVDLGGEYNLDAIRVTNFNSGSYAHRFKGTMVIASDSSRTELFNSGKLDAVDKYRKEDPVNNVRYISLYKEDEDDMTVQTYQIEAIKYK